MGKINDTTSNMGFLAGSTAGFIILWCFSSFCAGRAKTLLSEDNAKLYGGESSCPKCQIMLIDLTENMGILTGPFQSCSKFCQLLCETNQKQIKLKSLRDVTLVDVVLSAWQELES